MPTITETITGDVPASVAITKLTRYDNGLTPAGVTLPLAMTAAGAVWTATFTDPTAPIPSEYFYTFVATRADGSTSGPCSRTLIITPGGMWGTFNQAIGFYGVDNLNQWSVSRDTNAPDPVMQQSAFNRADNDIITEIQKQYCVIPGPTGALAANLAYIEAELFGAYLYEANGLQDSAKGMDGKIQAHLDHAMQELQELLFMNRGGFMRVTGYTDAPVGVGPSVDSLGRSVPATPPFPRPTWNGSFWTWG